LAGCKLDISNPRFQASIGDDADVLVGLERLRDNVAKDYKLSSWFRQPMQGYPEFQNKIWK
jgi:hypothetical protein